ncbi:unnamed protein product, partial [Ectocarpus sp. 8 AP-2014]
DVHIFEVHHHLEDLRSGHNHENTAYRNSIFPLLNVDVDDNFKRAVPAIISSTGTGARSIFIAACDEVLIIPGMTQRVYVSSIQESTQLTTSSVARGARVSVCLPKSSVSTGRNKVFL